MAIYRLLQNSAFEPEHIKVMTTAYEKALVTLKLRNRADPLTAIIARKIVEVAQMGHNDSDLICAMALNDLGLAPKAEKPDLSSFAKPVAIKKPRLAEQGSTPDQSLLAFASLVDQMPCAVGVMDLSGKWVLANEVMRRYVPETIPSRDNLRLQHWRGFDVQGRELEPIDWPGARALRGETAGVGFLYSENGREIPIHVAASPFLNAQGHQVGGVVTVHHIG